MSSILDTWVTIFEADTSKLEAGVKKSDAAADKLVDKLKETDKAVDALKDTGKLTDGIKQTEKGADKLTDALKDAGKQNLKGAEKGADALTDGLEASSKGADKLVDKLKHTDQVAQDVGRSFKDYAFGIYASLAGMVLAGGATASVFEMAETIRDLGNASDTLGESVENVDAFGKVALRLGGDAQGARDSLTDLAEAMGEAADDAESGKAKGFAALGLTLKDAEGNAKKPIAAFLDLADSIKDLDKSAAVFKVKDLGITDNRTIDMLMKGRVELERMLAKQKEQGVVTKENVEQAAKFNAALGDLKGSMGSFGLEIVTKLMPAFTAVIEWFTKVVDWVHEHQDLLVGFFAAIATIVTVMYLPAMIAAAVATLAATWPLLAIIAVIGAVAAAFALLYDDVMSFVAGNDSLIGQVFDKYPKLRQFVNDLASAFTTMGNIIAGVWVGIKEGFEAMLSYVMAGINKFSSGVEKVKGFLRIGGDDDNKGGKALTGPGANGGHGPDDVPQLPGVAGDMAKGKELLRGAGASPLNAASSASISNSATKNETNVQVGEVKVITQATDGNGIAKDVGGGLQDHLKQMNSEFATGRDR